MHFDPANIQEIGIGLSAFLSTLLATFIVTTAWRDNLARAMAYCLFSLTFFAWFGFFYHLTGDLWLARELRVLSVIGIVGIAISVIAFSFVYLHHRRPLTFFEQTMWRLWSLLGGVLLVILIGDLFGGRFVVGDLLTPPWVALAPAAGPLLIWVVFFYYLSALFTIPIIYGRVHLETDPKQRRQVYILMFSISVGLILGGTRFAPWYGWDLNPLLGGLGVPLFAVATFYAISVYSLFNVQVAVAELLVFILWTFTFFKMLLNPSLAAAWPDIALFVSALIIGIFLIRSVLKQQRLAAEVRELLVERAKTEFVTIAAHQLRTPATGLRWAFNILASESPGALTERQREIVRTGEQAAAQLVRLVADFLSVVRISEGKLEYAFSECDLGALLSAVRDTLDFEAQKKKVRIELSVPAGLPRMAADAEKLRMALQNIIDNAIKYSMPGGKVAVEVRTVPEGVEMRIIDSGIGVAEADQSRLFEKFFRSHSAAKMSPDGSGIGLFVSKTIVEAHGGTISLQSAGEGAGTTVTIHLPLLPPSRTEGDGGKRGGAPHA